MVVEDVALLVTNKKEVFDFSLPFGLKLTAKWTRNLGTFYVSDHMSCGVLSKCKI